MLKFRLQAMRSLMWFLFAFGRNGNSCLIAANFDMIYLHINMYIYMHGPWRFQPGPCVKPALVRPHTGPRSGRRRGFPCPPTHPPIAAAYCACCAVLLLRLPTAVLLSCYSYPQSLRRDGVEYISAGRNDDK